MASTLNMSSSSFLSAGCCLLTTAVLSFFFLCFFCLPTMTTAMPMKEVVEEAMMRARMEEHQEADHSRQKRAVSRTGCPQPANLDDIFQSINSELSSTGFLGTLYDNKAISIPAGEGPTYLDQDPNETKTCPTSLTTDSAAPLAHRSLCPFYFRTMVLPDGYFPATLRTAMCKCQKCVENTGYGCEAVSVEVAVLKPVGCLQGLQRYEEQMLQVDTGCVCATAGHSALTTTTATATTTTTASSPFVE